MDKINYKKVFKILEASPSAYEEMRFATYTNWCDVYSHNKRQMQKTVINRHIHRWFLTEYRKLELEFLNTVTPYLHLNTEDLRKYYASVTNKIFYRYPSALLDDTIGARDRKLLTPNSELL